LLRRPFTSIWENGGPVPEQIFTVPEAWVGGHYTLAINLVERSDKRSWAALNALTSYPLLNGWYESRNREPHEQSRITEREAIEKHHLGALSLPNGTSLRAAALCFMPSMSQTG
jgi:hypothetical protein